MGKILTTSEVRKVLGLSIVSVRYLIRQKLLRASRIGVRRWGVFEEDLQTFIKSRANTEPGEVRQ